ncbi:N-formylglutamate amidohydrolase [uncultured Sphingomonas sp.]|uniref:N-formylglutamate amidohydrolase n=1 Tax=uncultured Sphingomonas sp. TaxID=158754 RepID=UPI0035CBA568
MEPSFEVWGDLSRPASPVILSVPHAGRVYPAAMLPLLRTPLAGLRALEDRHVDAVALAARAGRTALVQRIARAWIDLNRGEDERDPAVDEGANPAPAPSGSAKLRSGLGLVPRRASATGEIWRRKLSDADVRARIAEAHRPYHQALEAALMAARARFGVAVLLDLHSMPPLGNGAAQVVIGDRFGRAAGGRFVARAEGAATLHGVRVSLNSPYAGGHVLDRHAAPMRGIHGLQLELDRTLYLDRRLDHPGPGLAGAVRLVEAIIGALEDEALSGGLAQAAE